MFADPAKSSHKTCYEVNHFIAYKNYLQGAMAYSETRKQVFSDMLMIDNREGVGMMI